MVIVQLWLYLLLSQQLVLHGASDNILSQNEILSQANGSFIDLSVYGEDIFGEPDVARTGKLVANHNSSTASLNPEELGTYLEGDILIANALRNENFGRNGVLTYSLHWPGGMVPYEINGHFTKQDLTIITHAFSEYHKKTCVRFRPRSNEPDYISIENSNTGCWSGIGRLGGRQIVNLQTPSCLRNYGTTIHELMHVLGFLHEQNRYERDAFVRILNDNIKPKMMINFKKASSKDTSGYGVAYDYASVLHYSPKSFSRNGKPTLEALTQTKDAELMGQRIGFSAGDVHKINAMYKCKRKAKSKLNYKRVTK